MASQCSNFREKVPFAPLSDKCTLVHAWRTACMWVIQPSINQREYMENWTLRYTESYECKTYLWFCSLWGLWWIGWWLGWERSEVGAAPSIPAKTQYRYNIFWDTIRYRTNTTHPLHDLKQISVHLEWSLSCPVKSMCMIHNCVRQVGWGHTLGIWHARILWIYICCI